MAYQTYIIPTHKKGDTFLGIIFTLKNGLGAAIDIDGALIELKTLSPHKYTLTTEDNGGISIIDESAAPEGQFMIDEQIIDWCAGEYEYEIEITLVSGVKRTWIKGTWLIEA